MNQFRNFYFGFALVYLIINWIFHNDQQKLIIETVVLAINMGFLFLYTQYENTWTKVAVILSQLLAAGLYGFFTIQMVFSANTAFSMLSFVLYDLFLFFSMLFFNQIVFKKTL
ncbi:hypothetical protein GFS24_22220 [Chitinophaga sp. SYP-B3965]|uniref:hypothetical protein n=1 Tax=Chitinophaga sp. SYP-B3965 TaxID=2663120 RepID=UPI0012999A8E|nr:hypothetical protein [Chitinophaga sp. SYP-B3965]MRG47855.1 hypothetical protein [Chitinophaga sp. SYP-B3965]